MDASVKCYWKTDIFAMVSNWISSSKRDLTPFTFYYILSLHFINIFWASKTSERNQCFTGVENLLSVAFISKSGAEIGYRQGRDGMKESGVEDRSR